MREYIREAANGLLFLSETGPENEEGVRVGNDEREELIYCLKKAEDLLSLYGAELSDLCALRIYCPMNTEKKMLENTVWELFEEVPALTILPVRQPGDCLSIDGTAALKDRCASCKGCSQKG